MTTIGTSTTLGLKLSPATYTSPVVIKPGVTVTNPGYPDAVYTAPSSATLFIIQNSGTISSTLGIGVYLAPGGSVTNAASASIVGGTHAVEIAVGSGTVVNDGKISATGGSAIVMEAGGTVTNAATASITGNSVGIEISSAAGTVLNDGAISASTGVRLDGGGTVANYGSISGGGGYGIDFRYGGAVTNAISASISSNNRGIDITGRAGTLVNEGRIVSGASYGVRLQSGGSVTNAPSGLIMGPSPGVVIGNVIGGGAGTVVNQGSVVGGIVVLNGGAVTNAASASITSANPGILLQGGGVVINDGSIHGGTGIRLNDGGTVVNNSGITAGDNYGVYVFSPGLVTNTASASIVAYDAGVDLHGGGTLTNDGTIIGQHGTAVAFGGTGSNLLVLDPGFKFSGLVSGSATANNTLELASAASMGTVAGLGSEYVHLQSIVFDTGAEWSISGIQRALGGTISGFAAGDTIVMTGVTATGSSFSGGILTLDQASDVSATLDLPGTFTLATDFHVATVPGGTEVTVACFAAGTRILTACGEVAVEELRIGDPVVTMNGRRIAPIVWLGFRRVDCVGHPRPLDVWPIRVKANAIADGVPHRDLWLSPEHSALVRCAGVEVLVPVRCLLNGSTIAQVPGDTITYWHVELASHDAIVAEGLPAETYLDTGNRADFANGGPATRMHPNFADTVWHAKACAPQLRHGDALAALRHRLAIRAAETAPRIADKAIHA